MLPELHKQLDVLVGFSRHVRMLTKDTEGCSSCCDRLKGAIVECCCCGVFGGCADVLPKLHKHLEVLVRLR